MTTTARLSAAVASLLLFAPPARAAELEVGVAVADITPPRGYRMAGYYAERVNTGTKDPLKAKAVVFRQGDTQAALVFCDLVSVPEQTATRARDESSRRSGIPASHIAVAATHSHTGPLFDGVLRKQLHEKAIALRGKDASEPVDYPETLVKAIGGVVVEAQSRLKPARVEAGFARETQLSFNRRFHMKDGAVQFNPGVLNPAIVRPAGPIDPEVGLLLVRPSENEKPVAGLTVFALHLDTVGGTEYSADYPHALEDALRDRFGSGFVSVFAAGTCGDINHIDVTRRDRIKTEDIGRTLAGKVVDAAPSLPPLKNPALAVAVERVDVPIQRFTAEEVAGARKVLDGFEANKTPFLEIVRAAKIVDVADNYPAANATFEVQAFRLGDDVALVTLPGEVFVEHGLAIKKDSPFQTTLVVELANACPAYVPTRKAFAEGSYEVINSRIAPGGGEQIVEAAGRALKSLATTRK